MHRTRLAILAALSLWGSLTPAQAGAVEGATTTPRQPVLVQFDGLLWVQAADGLPYIKGGQIVAPLLPLCDLFGARCTPDRATGTAQVRQAGQTASVPLAAIRQQGGKDVAFVSLKAMSAPLGYAVTWKAAAGRTSVQRVRRVPGGLSQLQGNVAGQRLTPVPLNAPAQVWTQRLPDSSSLRQLFLTASGAKLGRVWAYSRFDSGSTGRGGETGCRGSGAPVCGVIVGPGTLLTLVHVQVEP